MALLRKIPLCSGWAFKQKDDAAGSWTPVARVPTVNHVDLIENELWVGKSRPFRLLHANR